MSTMQDMTKGGAAGHLLRYAVPLMLGNWFQLAYNAVDSIIAGRFIGKDALAAEGIAGPVMNLVILGITGVCLGAGVLMSSLAQRTAKACAGNWPPPCFPARRHAQWWHCWGYC